MIGFFEFSLILIFALLFLGPDEIVRIARVLGKAYGEFKKLQREMEKEMR